MTPKKEKDYKWFLPNLADETSNLLRPKRIGAIPKLAVLLGLLSPQFFEIYNFCDGVKNISTIATDLKQDVKQMRINIDKLVKSKMISFD